VSRDGRWIGSRVGSLLAGLLGFGVDSGPAPAWTRRRRACSVPVRDVVCKPREATVERDMATEPAGSTNPDGRSSTVGHSPTLTRRARATARSHEEF
jgi:hypothetical protein